MAQHCLASGNFLPFGCCSAVQQHCAMFSEQKEGFETQTLGDTWLEEMSECQERRGGIVCNCLLTMEEFEYQRLTKKTTLESFICKNEFPGCVFHMI